MGPQPNALEEVKRDAIRATTRHFKNEIEDNNFQADPAQLDRNRDQLLHENSPEGRAEAEAAQESTGQPAEEVAKDQVQKPRGRRANKSEDDSDGEDGES